MGRARRSPPAAPRPHRQPVGPAIKLRLTPELREQLDELRIALCQPELPAFIRFALGQWCDWTRIQRGAIYAELPEVIRRQVEFRELDAARPPRSRLRAAGAVASSPAPRLARRAPEPAQEVELLPRGRHLAKKPANAPTRKAGRQETADDADQHRQHSHSHGLSLLPWETARSTRG